MKNLLIIIIIGICICDLSFSRRWRMRERHNTNLTALVLLDGRNVTVDLQLNARILAKDFLMIVQRGRNVSHAMGKLNLKQEHPCHYTGQIRNKSKSWVALATCNGLSGAIYDGENMFYINNDTETYGIVRLKDTGVARFERSPTLPDNTILTLYNNKYYKKNIRYIELVLVIEYGTFITFGKDTNKIETFSKNLINLVNKAYAPLNIFVALVGFDIWTKPITNNHHRDLSWYYKLLKKYPNFDHVHIITQVSIEKNNSSFYQNKICSKPSISYSIYNTSLKTPQWVLFSYALGKNLGMKNNCIMEAIVPDLKKTWSKCNINQLEKVYKDGFYDCLKNKPSSLFGGPSCGNGFLEEGEECDCGLEKKCFNNCCNATSCKLYYNTIC